MDVDVKVGKRIFLFTVVVHTASRGMREARKKRVRRTGGVADAVVTLMTVGGCALHLFSLLNLAELLEGFLDLQRPSSPS